MIILASEGFSHEKRHSSNAVAPIEDLAYRHNPVKKRKATSTANIRAETYDDPLLKNEKDFQKMEIITEKELEVEESVSDSESCSGDELG